MNDTTEGVGASDAGLKEAYGKLQAALQRQSRIRVLVVVLVAAVLVVLAAEYYGLIKGFDQEALRQEALVRAEQRLPQWTDELRRLVNDVAPAVQQAFAAEFRKGAPEIMEVVNAEYPKFVANTTEKLEEQLNKAIDDVISRQEKLLLKEVPALKDEKKMEQCMTAFVQTLGQMGHDLLVEDFQQELNGLIKAWEQFPAKEVPPEQAKEVSSTITGLMLEVLKHRLLQRPEAGR